jgi:hypothetical protein
MDGTTVDRLLDHRGRAFSSTFTVTPLNTDPVTVTKLVVLLDINPLSFLSSVVPDRRHMERLKRMFGLTRQMYPVRLGDVKPGPNVAMQEFTDFLEFVEEREEVEALDVDRASGGAGGR